MKIARVILLFLGFVFSFSLFAADPQVEFRTNYGNFVIELYPEKAPKTVANFLEYVNTGFYEYTVFHRVIDRFMVQGGGFSPDLKQKETAPPIPSEADNGLKNTFGTVAMARRFDPNTAAAEFFINIADNNHLNYYKPEPALMGYCVFGRVVQGMEVVESIAHIPTHSVGKLKELPVQDVVIEKVALLETPVMYAEREKKPDVSPSERIVKSSRKGKKRG